MSVPKASAEIRQKYSLPLDQAVVTLFGGGIDNAKIRLIIEGLLRGQQAMHLFVVAGRNETLIESLDDLRSSPLVSLHVLGYIDFVDDLIVSSDLVITKAGGLIVSEVLARGTPLIVIEPILGQEEWNADYIVSTGAGVQLRMADAVAPTVQRLFQQTHVIQSMAHNANMVGRGRAAFDIVHQLLDEWTLRQARETVQGVLRHRPRARVRRSLT